MIIKKILQKNPEDYRKQIALGMSFLLIGILLQQIGIVSSQFLPEVISLSPFLSGLLAGIGTVLCGASIYLNIRGFQNYQKINSAK